MRPSIAHREGCRFMFRINWRGSVESGRGRGGRQFSFFVVGGLEEACVRWSHIVKVVDSCCVLIGGDL